MDTRPTADNTYVRLNRWIINHQWITGFICGFIFLEYKLGFVPWEAMVVGTIRGIESTFIFLFSNWHSPIIQYFVGHFTFQSYVIFAVVFTFILGAIIWKVTYGIVRFIVDFIKYAFGYSDETIYPGGKV